MAHLVELPNSSLISVVTILYSDRLSEVLTKVLILVITYKSWVSQLSLAHVASSALMTKYIWQ
jgi:hypothetical protein